MSENERTRNRSFFIPLFLAVTAALHLFQKGIYLFGPEGWLSPEVMRTYSLWQLVVDMLSGIAVGFASLPASPRILFALALVLDLLICALLIRCCRIFGKKFLFMALLFALPLVTVMPGPDPTQRSSHIAAILSWAVWWTMLVAAVIFVFRHRKNVIDLVFVILLALIFAIVVPSWSYGDSEIEIPVGLIGGTALIMVYSLRMIREKGYHTQSP